MTTTLTLDTLLDYAGIRYADGTHLAAQVISDLEAGTDAITLRDDAAAEERFLYAYFADCADTILEAQ